MKPDAQPSKWNPGFEYLDDPEILKLQTLMDDSLFYLQDNKEKSAKALEDFRKGMAEMLASLPKIAQGNPARIKSILLFVRRNLRDLDLGGLSAGRSHQNNIFVEMNKYFVDNHKDLWDKVAREEYTSRE